jgi:hypothetical protein
VAYDLIPGFRSLRVPARLALLFNFAGAGLAALAVNGWYSEPGTLRKVGPWLAVLVVGAELVIFGANVEVQPEDPRGGYDHADAIAWLNAQPDTPFRVEGAPASAIWQPDNTSLWGGNLYDLYGISNPLALAAYDTYYWGVGSRGSPTYNFLGAKYVIAQEGEPPGDASFVPVYEAESGVTVTLNTRALPLASLVYQGVPVASGEAAWAAIHAPDWNPQATVYVEDGPALDSQPPEGAGLFFSVYEPNVLAVVVNTPQPAYLVLSETYYPGWQATIDGEPAPIYRANTAFRAVYIAEPGEHTVLLSFRPLSVIIGLAISGLTVVGLAAAFLKVRRATP